VSSTEGEPTPKPVVWIGSSKDDVSELPTEVKLVFGHALYLAQIKSRLKLAKQDHERRTKAKGKS
jgi:phage-related protein